MEYEASIKGVMVFFEAEKEYEDHSFSAPYGETVASFNGGAYYLDDIKILGKRKSYPLIEKWIKKNEEDYL